jgi:GNAT superfamily N-acetyltransferase
LIDPPSSPGKSSWRVRQARAGDHATIVDFNARLAAETEGKRLEPSVLARGVTQALADPDRLRYWVAEYRDSPHTKVVGQAAITREWSDWRNGWLWWFQSVYVHPDHRGRGVFRALYQQIRSEALADADVIGLRLYVENANAPAQSTYQALGMKPGGYQVYEDLWLERSNGGGGE